MPFPQLRQARSYEAAQGAALSPEQRPLFHLTPTAGWLNDPNGFSVYRGEYHLFYQYHPYCTAWGPMHWGHCKSKDLLHWERLPAALAPDQPYDQDGCFSGSAAETPDGRHVLMYTGVQKDAGQEYQTQCIAIGDGINYEKHRNNPVITGDQLPSGSCTHDFRDPKLWREGARWFAAAGSRTEDGSGAILLYTSFDLEHWTLEGMLDRSRNQWGRMWECPDFFQLDGQAVLLVSPQELVPPDPRFQSGYESLCLLGSWDRETNQFTRRSVLPIDQGLDFYAPQTLLAPDGRRIIVAWMQNWSTAKCVPEGQTWFGQMTLPRELHLQDGRLIQRPIRELERWRGECTAYEGLAVSGDAAFPGISGRTLDLTLRLQVQSGTFTLKFAQDEHHFTALLFQPDHNLLTLDRARSALPNGQVPRRSVPVRARKGQLDLRLILDRFSVEVFVNGGEQVLSATLYTPQEADRISFCAQGQTLMDIQQYRLAPSLYPDRRR
ncbi:glycoside hydrolase family 32 protein [Pseudoflavonifractor sp. 524-17]|uniref:glycoside hydrolase family 32 protein n=1 Tax=Pseudoflavonifractor sp. 524-17 TaxID=2304577 RepID=UPI00137B2A78|nr:glycoside hydrolase family 32 protein [Pseudoflavonifractor sp. 524-17]NCE65711.1 glycoside hydrolase family 32 protein [Pseudoflavonifractor sp. 524-17]